MKNEENIGFIDKKASKDQLVSLVSVTFCQLSFGALSLFSLSLSRALGHLEFSWSILALEQERKIMREE